MTKQREVILDEIKRTSAHPTADQLYEMVRKKLPRVSIGTIYRNLEQLCRSGVIKKLNIASSQSRYDGNTENHYHVYCIDCGSVNDLHLKIAKRVENEAKNSSDHEIFGHTILFWGRCKKCSD